MMHRECTLTRFADGEINEERPALYNNFFTVGNFMSPNIFEKMLGDMGYDINYLNGDSW